MIALVRGSPILNRMTRTERRRVDPELKGRIEELIESRGGGFNQESVADIIENALKLLKDVEDSGDVRVIHATFSFHTAFNPEARHLKNALGGGGIMNWQHAVQYMLWDESMASPEVREGEIFRPS